MVFVNSDGTVTEKKSKLRWSTPLDAVWSVLNFFWLFINTLINPASERHTISAPRDAPKRKGFGSGVTRGVHDE
ncbi:hypothetical protein M885DRAFT_518885 [Pelagophyceae sp. CCMP2097]|nr:hypothetical protein M885DRAFT_518885 [Pelagophyceae sp. CCMP2097]